MVVIEGLEVTAALIALICVFLGGYWIYLKKHNYWIGKPIPSDSPIPIVGTFGGALLGQRIHEIDQKLYDKYGRIFGTYEGPYPIIYVADPELIKSIFVKDFSSFTNRRVFSFDDPILDNMISAIPGDDKWRNIRNTLTRAFTSGRLKKVGPIVNKLVKGKVSVLKTRTTAPSTIGLMSSAKSNPLPLHLSQPVRIQPIPKGKRFGSADATKQMADITMMPLISDCAKLVVENMEKYSKNGEPVDCRLLYGNYTMDVIANVAFGTQLDSHNDPDNKFVQYAKKVVSEEISFRQVFSMMLPKFARLLGIHFVPPEIIDFFKDLTLEIVRRRETNNEVRQDLLQILMESLKEDSGDSKKDTTEKTINDEFENFAKSVDEIKRKPLTMNEFLAQTIMFFLVAYETTSIAITSTSYFLATNPECQKKVLEEVDRIWKNRTTIDFEAYSEAKYIGAAIDEALRLVPPAIRIERTCVKDYQLGDTGVTIPRGMLVQIPTFCIHRDPEFFPEPEKFKPERFLDEGKTTIANSYTYLPFGVGPRNCIAMRLALMEVKLCLLHVLKNFELSPSAKTKNPLEFRKSMMLQPKDVILHVTKRN